MCRKKLASFFLQGTHWNRGNSHQPDACFPTTADILMENSHRAECPNALWSGAYILLWQEHKSKSTGPRPGRKLSTRQSLQYNGANNRKKEYKASNTKMSLRESCTSAGATVLICVQKSKKDLKSRVEETKCLLGKNQCRALLKTSSWYQQQNAWCCCDTGWATAPTFPQTKPHTFHQLFHNPATEESVYDNTPSCASKRKIKSREWANGWE